MTATVLSAVLLAACGGGGGGDAATPSGGATTTASAAPGVTLTLSNLPSETTTSGNASIGYQVSASGNAAVVTCRLDSYTPIECPNPFVLGQATALKAGVHTVEYFVDTGGGVDLTKPAASYSWTVEAPAAAAATSTASTASTGTTASTAGATPLASAPYPVPVDLTGGSNGSYAGSESVTGSDGIVRLSAVSDPGGSGKSVYLHRIVRDNHNGGSTSVRAEKVWIDKGQYLLPGNDYWFAFAFRPKSGEWPATTPGMSDDEFLVMQTHSESTGGTQPDIALFINTGLGKMRWVRSWNASPQPLSQAGTAELHSQSLPTVDTWYKYIVHYRPGYTSAQSPMTEIWQAVGDGSFAKIVSDTGLNTYNWNTGSYPRIGHYKWSGTNWASNYPTIAAYFTTLYIGQGSNGYDSAAASLAGL